MIQNPTSGYMLKEVKAVTQAAICTILFVAALFIIDKRWKQLKCTPTDGCIHKIWFTHTVEYYSATERKGILIYAIVSINPKDIMLSKIIQRQKGKHSMIPFI